jgi:hypothetical protein
MPKDCFAAFLMEINLQIFPICHAGVDRHPDSTSVGFVFWIPACAGMTVFFLDFSPSSGVRR